ncbi:MAG: hypothetical protein FVQ83_09635 [Chloroflexi bacterium]|nr:hypothetical protein [Chloroflexota bacterium]
MSLNIYRRLWNNISTFLFAFLLALAVWISAVVADDPNEECASPNRVALELIGQNPGLMITRAPPETVEILLRAPSSICRVLANETDRVQASINLSQLGSGEFTVPVKIDVFLDPVRLIEVLPQEVIIEMETILANVLEIQTLVSGEPALGFQAESLVIDNPTVEISGPQSLVEQVVAVFAELDINESQTTVSEDVDLEPIDENGNVISGVTLNPEAVTLTLPIVQAVGYRTVIVILETTGQPAAGFQLSEIQIQPPTVTLSSALPQLLEDLPGYVSTLPLDLTDHNTDITNRLALDLPTGVDLEGEQSVLVFVGITPIEGTTNITLPVEFTGLEDGLGVQISPESVEVFITGPLVVLDEITQDDVHIFIDLSGLAEGTYIIDLSGLGEGTNIIGEPRFEVLPGLQVDSINPPSIQVDIFIQLTPPAMLTPTITPTPTPTLTPTPSPTP